MQLPDTQVKSEFLTSFGRPPRLVCDAGERSTEPNVPQALHVINGDTLNQKLSDPNGYAALAVKLGSFGFQDSRPSFPFGIQPLSDGRRAAAHARCAAQGAPTAGSADVQREAAARRWRI